MTLIITLALYAIIINVITLLWIALFQYKDNKPTKYPIYEIKRWELFAMFALSCIPLFGILFSVIILLCSIYICLFGFDYINCFELRDSIAFTRKKIRSGTGILCDIKKWLIKPVFKTNN